MTPAQELISLHNFEHDVTKTSHTPRHKNYIPTTSLMDTSAIDTKLKTSVNDGTAENLDLTWRTPGMENTLHEYDNTNGLPLRIHNKKYKWYWNVENALPSS